MLTSQNGQWPWIGEEAGKNSGTLRVTDTATNKPKPCTKNEHPLDITPGQPGPKGDKGEAGMQDLVRFHRDYTDVLVPVNGTKTAGAWGGAGAGKYHVSAKVVLGTTDPVASVSCQLVAHPSMFVIDKAFATLVAPPGGDIITTSLHVEGAADLALVTLDCTVPHGFITDSVITMTPVNDIDAT